MKKLKENKGFTLIELLLVVVIIGLMLAVIVPRAWRANIDAKYGLVKQNCSELAAFGMQWAENSLHAQNETNSTATLNDYIASLCAVSSAPGLPAYNWVARAGNWNWNNNGTQLAITGRSMGAATNQPPEDSVEDIVPPDKIPRNPFNGVSVFELPNDPVNVTNTVTGAIACAGISEGAAGWYYYALIFQGTDNTGLTDFHAGQGTAPPANIAGLRNGIFMARLR